MESREGGERIHRFPRDCNRCLFRLTATACCQVVLLRKASVLFGDLAPSTAGTVAMMKSIAGSIDAVGTSGLAAPPLSAATVATAATAAAAVTVTAGDYPSRQLQ